MRKTPDPIDVHVGGRVKWFRQRAGLTQGELGKAIGVTFQQVQKYENGANRIGASRLRQIAAALNAPLPAFFSESDEAAPARDDLEAFATEFLTSDDGGRFLRAFREVRDPHTRRTIVDLVVSLAAAEAAPKRAGRTRRLISAA